MKRRNDGNFHTEEDGKWREKRKLQKLVNQKMGREKKEKKKGSSAAP